MFLITIVYYLSSFLSITFYEGHLCALVVHESWKHLKKHMELANVTSRLILVNKSRVPVM